MKKVLLKIGCYIFSLCIVFSCQQNENEKYIFFLHSRFLEGQTVEKWHPDYGKIESYYEVLKKYQKAGFKVISEKRKANVNAREYAVNVVRQIDSLLNNGVSPQSITIVGISKGGYIAQYVSTIAANPDLNFVFIASFVDNDIENIPGINYCGNILTIYEKSDPFGVSALERFNTSNCDIKHFQEIELNTGLQHGFIFEPLEAWINPSIQWANRNYEAFEVNDLIYK